MYRKRGGMSAKLKEPAFRTIQIASQRAKFVISSVISHIWELCSFTVVKLVAEMQHDISEQQLLFDVIVWDKQ